jgi:hypothetical protein
VSGIKLVGFYFWPFLYLVPSEQKLSADILSYTFLHLGILLQTLTYHLQITLARDPKVRPAAAPHHVSASQPANHTPTTTMSAPNPKAFPLANAQLTNQVRPPSRRPVPG